MTRTVTFKGKPLTLTGQEIKLNQSAPDFTVTLPDLKDFTLKDAGNKIKLITTFPSLDTPVCDLQVKEFNKRAAGLSKEVQIIGISKDLPFAQKRFCDSFGISSVTIASDYKSGSFGLNYGLLIKELALLARAVLILDKTNVVRYLQIVSELTQAPDYDAALDSLKKILA